MLSEKVERLMSFNELTSVNLNSSFSIFNLAENFDIGSKTLIFLCRNWIVLDHDYALRLLERIRRNKTETSSLDLFDFLVLRI